MLLTRTDLESREHAILAPYAVFSTAATRHYPDTPESYRTAFARDRARIIHSKSFRRLRGKTQVFVAHYGDHYRNRLTHTLEVAQISRELARSLGVNEDLAECIALAHDLGHTPFGHVGERRMSELLRPFGLTFEHNRQSRRIVTELEKKYPGHPGLNLTLPVLDGLAKHATPYDHPDPTDFHQPSLEAQIVDIADEIAYTNHDLDDGLRSGILTREALAEIPLWHEATATVDPTLPDEAFVHRAVSALIDRMVRDIIETTATAIKKNDIRIVTDIEKFPARLVTFSPALAPMVTTLRSFLFQRFYLSPTVSTRSAVGAEVISTLFVRLLKNPDRITPEFHDRLALDPPHVVVADFIAGMTDGYAEEFLAKLGDT